VAVTDTPEGYPYGPRVHFEIRESVQSDYRLAADYLNIQQTSVVCVQHEYGIYGGVSGSHILAFLRRLQRPVVTTLHTVLKEPTPEQRQILRQIVRLCDRVVVLSEIGRTILQENCGVEADKIAVIPHGIADTPFMDSSFFKDRFGAEGKKVLLTFGLLTPGKGIENVIAALPDIVSKHPEVVYVVLGATHPNVKRESGEEYRNGLIRTVHDLGMDEHVVFQNRFVEVDELLEYLGGADIYITPYLNEAQVVSGTLAYALGAGKAIISTPYWHAVEMLADGRGRIVPFNDSDAIAGQVNDLLSNDTERDAMRKRAYMYCRKMIWPQVAKDYLNLFAQVREAWGGKASGAGRQAGRPSHESERARELPEPDLRHLRIMTDDTGLLQHCRYTTPDRNHGYCTDDNGRALIVTAMHWTQTRDERILPLMQKYLSFVAHALDARTGLFRTFMTYERTWIPDDPSEDAHARALWGLGTAVAFCPHESMIALATNVFRQALPVAERFTSPRAWALAILGIHAYLRRFSGDTEMRRWRTLLSERLLKAFTGHMTDDWPWCEDTVTYCNANLPHAMLISGKWMGRQDMVDVGAKSLDWLLKVQTAEDGMLSLIGNDGWHPRGGAKARFDQQPVDACGLVDACIEAFHVTGDGKWVDQAFKAFNWFLGDNDLRSPVYDFTTGGCRDGLQQDRVNENQGAESTLSWLQSVFLMQQLQMEQTLGEAGPDKLPAELSVPRAIRAGGPVRLRPAGGAKVGSAA
jgi:glycosyltransferase involved in cell wall biosynthesis